MKTTTDENKYRVACKHVAVLLKLCQDLFHTAHIFVE